MPKGKRHSSEFKFKVALEAAKGSKTLADALMLCTYGYRREPFGVRACLSSDGGRTWDTEHEYVLRADGVNVDLGYPSSVQLADGALLTVYYIHTGDNVRHIAGTLWRAE